MRPAPITAAWLALAPFAAEPARAESPLLAAEEGDDAERSLREAENRYREAVARFKMGDVEGGRDALRKAFALVVEELEDESLSAALHTDFLRMLEKVRNWDPPEPNAPSTGELDVPEEALGAVSSTDTQRQMPRTIKVDAENPITRKYIEVYTKQRPETVVAALERSGRYKAMIEAALAAKGLPRELLYLVMTESEFKPEAVSRVGAAGLWQFMPYTARKYGLEVSYWVDERYDPAKATEAALRYLADLFQWFGDWQLALAAYNRGEGGIGRDLRFTRAADFDALSDRNGLPSETRHYVPKFMACVLIGEHPESYGLTVKYEEPDAYDEAPLPRELDLGIAAKAAGTTEDEIRRLNPALRAWCTPKNRPGYPIRVPKGKRDEFLAALAKVEDWNPGPSLVRYRVEKGDYLGKIAKRHHTTVKAILEINRLKSAKLLRTGMTLVIRPGRPSKKSGR